VEKNTGSSETRSVKVVERRRLIPANQGEHAQGLRNSRVSTWKCRSEGCSLSDGSSTRPTLQQGRPPPRLCDVLSKVGEFIHVKRKSSSSCLGHLFAQGSLRSTLVNGSMFPEEIRQQIQESVAPEKQAYA
jgi:hypothetical protein